ncbi:YqcI/YcgG family protein [Priestia endophytica]
MTTLYTKEILEENPTLLESWERKVFTHFSEKLSDKKAPFPCIPATQGFSLNQLRYGFLRDIRTKESAQDLKELLSRYTTISRSTGKYASLIIFAETPEEVVEEYEVEDYYQWFWNTLNTLAREDEKEWPTHIPKDANDSAWEFCFHGERYFMYCATPAHKRRQSRSFPCVMLAITPRWVLETFNASKQKSQRVQESIRKRIVVYDSIGPHLDLNVYGTENNYEWKQYFLTDDETSHTKCPFEHLWKEKHVK